VYTDSYFGRGRRIFYVSRHAPDRRVQSSSAQARSICATGDGDGDGIETGIQWKRIRERNKDKGKVRRLMATRDYERVLLPEVPGDIGRSWSESSVAW
jgi:hypothetical protein